MLGSWRYEDSEVPDFDAPLAAARALPRVSGRPVPRRRAARHLAGRLQDRPSSAMASRARARHARRPPADRLRALASRTPARPRRRALARSLQLPAGDRAPDLRGLAVRRPTARSQALLGTVAGWNVFVLLTYVGAGGLTALWLRALGLGLEPALVGGLAFALAPTGSHSRPAICSGRSRCCCRSRSLRSSAGWRGSPLWRSRRFRSRVRCTSRSARSRSCSPTRSRGAGAGTARSRRPPEWRPGRSSGGSHSATRSSAPTPRSSALLGVGERLPLPRPGEFERFVYLGWLLPLLADAGPRLLVFQKHKRPSRRGLALALGLGALVPALLALGSNLPGYGVILAKYAPQRDRNCPSGCCR